MQIEKKLKQEEKLSNLDFKKLNKELAGKEFYFFSENFDSLKPYLVVKITDKYVLLRESQENVIKNREVEIIEFLTLNFPESEEYKFSFEEWKNLWLKYGGWLPKNFNLDFQELSIKEARELFSKLPSKIELLLDYFHSVKKNLYFFMFLKDANQQTLLNYIKSLDIYFDKSYFLKIINIEDEAQEIKMAKIREKLFNKPIPLELLDEFERSKIVQDYNKISGNDYLVRLSLGRTIKPNNEFDQIVYFILESSVGGTLLFTSENRFNTLFNPSFYPPNIFGVEKIEEIPIDELDAYLEILLKSTFLRNFQLFSENIYKEIVENILYSRYLVVLLKTRPEIVFVSPTNIIPYTFFIKYLLKYTKEILKERNNPLEDKIKIPKFIFINTEANYLRSIINKEYMGNFTDLFEELKQFINNKKLEEFEEKLDEILSRENFSEDKKNFYRYLIKSAIWLKRKLIPFFEKINSIHDLEREVYIKRNLLIAFLDDAFGAQFATYNITYILLYLSIRDILQPLKRPEMNLDLFNERIDEIIRKILPSDSLLPPGSSIQDLFTMIENLRIMEAGRDIFISLLPIVKIKFQLDDQNLPFRHKLPHHISDKDKKLKRNIVNFNRRKVEILKLAAQKLATHFADYIEQHPFVVY